MVMCWCRLTGRCMGSVSSQAGTRSGPKLPKPEPEPRPRGPSRIQAEFNWIQSNPTNLFEFVGSGSQMF